MQHPHLSSTGQQQIPLPIYILLPSTLATSYLNSDSQPPTKMPRKAPEKLQTHCLGHHKPYQREKGQARPSTAGHVGSSSLPSSHPGSNGSNSAQRGRHSRAPVTSLATRRAMVRAASLVIPRSQNRPRIQVLHAHKHALVLGHVTALPRPRAASAPQGIQLSQREPWGCWSQPDLCACSRKVVAGTGSH